MREQLGFPPFGRLIRIVFRGKSLQKVSNAATEWAKFLNDRSNGVLILGPAECALAIVSGNHRRQLLLRSDKAQRLHRLMAQTDDLERFSGVYIEIDVDPIALL